ncbi:MAG TPA: hypothetical protein VHE56_09015 [Mycobacteriales bacterium]|nr:hypothetical protein [Mycobacteriales bacterium]
MTTHHSRTAIATGTCLTFGVAVAVAIGAVPQVSGTSSPATVSVAAPSAAHFLRLPAHIAVAHHAARHVRHAAHSAHVATSTGSGAASSRPASNPASTYVSGFSAQPADAGTTSAEAANIKHAVAHHHKQRHHHKKRHHHHATTTKPKLAPRTTPSASAVSSAIAGLRSYVHTPFTPTSAQVGQFGDEVCSAFDQNETFAHVKSVILAKVKQLPFTTVSAGAADYVVKTAVALYCPGYKSKVS